MARIDAFTAKRLLIWALVWGQLGATSRSTGADEVEHWAFRPIQRPQVPLVQDRGWPKNAIDAFVLAALDGQGVRPSPPADPSVLLRRVTLDLLGLPPRPEEADAFAQDYSEGAYQTVVEGLLASPHYGERWARHWLDVARYADSAGYEFDNHREIWRYRDWVIHALNADMPYDQFVIEQCAGDLLPDATRDQRIATGFSCNALKQYGDVHETTADRVNAFGAAVLGLTLGCASCHDHKFDPISQREYYQLYAFFNEAEDTVLDLSPPEITAGRDALQRQVDMLKKELYLYQNGPDPDPLTWAAQLTGSELRATPSEVRQSIIRSSADRTPEQVTLIRQYHQSIVSRYQQALEDRITAWGAGLSEAERRQLGPEAATYFDLPPGERSAHRPPGMMAKFWEQDAGRRKRQEIIESLEKSVPDTETTLVLQARSDHPQTFVFIRGNHLNLGAQVEPGTPAILPPLRPETGTANRLDLARWAASPENPLTARVIVNRIWQAYFGRGIVPTSEDFGVQAPKPRHVALLDWLAAELIDSGWSLKHLHRLIVSSATYRQSSHQRPDLQEVDPQNELLARQSRMRFEAEIIRDAALVVSGLLNDKVGGPSVFPYQPEGVMAGRADGAPWTMSEGADRFRRGMYTHFWRLTPHPHLTLFDAPDATEACTRRSRSNTPVQALTLLNDPTFKEAAVALAERVVDEPECSTDQERLAWAFKECLSRTPSAEELAALDRLLSHQQASFESDPSRARQLTDSAEDVPASEAATLAAWTSVSRALLNLDEFITRE